MSNKKDLLDSHRVLLNWAVTIEHLESHAHKSRIGMTMSPVDLDSLRAAIKTGTEVYLRHNPKNE